MDKFRPDSFLRNADFRDNIFLGLNKLPKISEDSSDESYIIQPAYDQRPDLLSHKVYSNSRLWWVFAIRNPDVLVDPIRDFTSGKTIWIPSLERINKTIS